MVGQQSLVGRNDVLAGFQCSENERLRRRRSPDEFDDDVDRRVVQCNVRIGRDNSGREFDSPYFVEVANDDRAKHQRPARPLGESVAVIEEQFRHAGADGTAAENRNAERFTHGAGFTAIGRRRLQG